MTGAKHHQIENTVPPCDQSEDWLKQQMERDSALALALAHASIPGERASEWAPLGDELVIRWASPSDPRLPPESQLLYFVAKRNGYFAVQAILFGTPPARELRVYCLVSHMPGLLQEPSPFRSSPEVLPAQLATIGEAKAAIDDRPEAIMAWERGCLTWWPALDQRPQWLPALTWHRADRELWMRAHRGTLFLVTGKRGIEWVLSVRPHNLNPNKRSKKIGVFPTREEAFAFADDYILNLT
jgi:hypothetical protein